MEKFMNPPVRHKWNAADIREEHRQGRELKRIAKRYCITNKEVRELLGEPKRIMYKRRIIPIPAVRTYFGQAAFFCRTGRIFWNKRRA